MAYGSAGISTGYGSHTEAGQGFASIEAVSVREVKVSSLVVSKEEEDSSIKLSYY